MFEKYLSRDFKAAALNQIWRLLSGPLLLFLIPLYLTEQVQGFWFTFISLGALATFADLGFTTIILQFAAHEFAHLSFDQNNKIVGDRYYKERLSSLLQFSIHWAMAVAFAAFPVVFIVGFLVLSSKNSEVDWFLPWLIYGLGSVLLFVSNTILSFIEGCDSVGNIQKGRLYVSVVYVLAAVSSLIFRFDLYSLSFALFGSAVFGFYFIISKYGSMLEKLYRHQSESKFDWKHHILPLLGKYSVSWISGFLIFSLFTPIAFHFYGAEQAGRIGLSIAAWISVFGLSNVWITIIVPKINMLVQNNDYTNLDSLFFRHLMFAIGTYLLVSLVFFILYFVVGSYSGIVSRIVGPIELGMLSLCWLFQLIINTLAVYMRAHKQEPLVYMSVAMGFYTSSTTLIIATYFDAEYLFLGFLTSYVWATPWVLSIFKTFRGKSIES